MGDSLKVEPFLVEREVHEAAVKIKILCMKVVSSPRRYVSLAFQTYVLSVAHALFILFFLQFPGSGRKLADSSSSASASSSSGYFGLPMAAASFGGTVARPPGAVVVPVATPVSTGALPSREEIAARRLAALEAQQRNFGNMASAPPLPSDHNHNNV